MEASAVRESRKLSRGILLQAAKNLASGITATCWLGGFGFVAIPGARFTVEDGGVEWAT